MVASHARPLSFATPHPVDAASSPLMAAALKLSEAALTIVEELNRYRDALVELIDLTERYMKYHGEKFYPDSDPEVTRRSGLWPAIVAAKAVLVGSSAHLCPTCGPTPVDHDDIWPCHGCGVYVCVEHGKWAWVRHHPDDYEPTQEWFHASCARDAVAAQGDDGDGEQRGEWDREQRAERT